MSDADNRRRSPRVPILTQVEAQGEAVTALGRARDISIGGLLIETPETFAEGATVVVRFFIPNLPRPVQAAGRVVRAAEGKSMAISFLGLRPSDQEKVLEYIAEAEGEQIKAFFSGMEKESPPVRRSARIPRQMSVVLSWQDDEGRTQQESVQTQLLSKHGAMVLSIKELEPGQLLRIAVPDSGKKGVSRVVWVKAAEVPGRVEVGIELLGTENFWDMEFPLHRAAPAALPSVAGPRRRGGRMLRRTPVILSWTDELGRPRQEMATTSELSPHGALIEATVPLPLGQRFRLRAPEISREAEAQVIHLQEGELPGIAELGIEFVEVQDFWDTAFPPDQHPST